MYMHAGNLELQGAVEVVGRGGSVSDTWGGLDVDVRQLPASEFILPQPPVTCMGWPHTSFSTTVVVALEKSSSNIPLTAAHAAPHFAGSVNHHRRDRPWQ